MSRDKDGWTGAEVGAGCVVTLLWMPFAIVFGAWALMVVWNWWIPTTIAGAPALSLKAAIGIGMVRSYLSAGRVANEKNADGLAEVIGKMATGVALTLIVVGVAWVAQAVAF